MFFLRCAICGLVLFMLGCSSSESYYTIDEVRKIRVQESFLDNDIPVIYFPSEEKNEKIGLFFKGGFSSESLLLKGNEEFFLSTLMLSLPNEKIRCQTEYDYSFCLIDTSAKNVFKTISDVYKAVYNAINSKDVDLVKQQIKRDIVDPRLIAKERLDDVFFVNHPYHISKINIREKSTNIRLSDIVKSQKNLLCSDKIIILYTGSKIFFDVRNFLNKSFGKISKTCYKDIQLPEMSSIVSGKRPLIVDKRLTREMVAIRIAVPQSKDISSLNVDMSMRYAIALFKDNKQTGTSTIQLHYYPMKQPFYDVFVETNNTEVVISAWDEAIKKIKSGVQLAEVEKVGRPYEMPNLPVSSSESINYVMQRYLRTGLISTADEKTLRLDMSLTGIDRAIDYIQKNQRIYFLNFK